MRKLIICDTSCFIVLSKIGEMDLLYKLYGSITTTPQIAGEFGKGLPDWVETLHVADESKIRLLETQIGRGEASAIALAIEKRGCLLILDDYKARRLAAQLELSYTGTLGIIVAAKQKGIVPSAKHLINKIKQTNFRISPELELKALMEAEE